MLCRAAVQVDIGDIVRDESSSATPLLLVSKPGFDASGKVDALAQACAVLCCVIMLTSAKFGVFRLLARLLMAATRPLVLFFFCVSF